jgi:hypothetical protein
MPFAPGHFQQATRRRYRSRRELVAVRLAAVMTLVIVGVVVFSLTTHQATSGGGCIDFNYTTMIGGGEAHKCGSEARTLCATRPSRQSIDGDYLPELYAACRKANIPTGRA